MGDVLWRLLACVGLYSSVSYDQEAPRQSQDDVILPLDPIYVAKSANLGRIRDLAVEMDLKFCITALAWLQDPSHLWLEGQEPTKINDHRPSSKKYTEHFRQMWQDFKIMDKLIGPGNLLFISGYFSVAKDALVSRAIFSGRALSKLFRAAPPVNIPSIQDIFSRLGVLVGLGNRKANSQSGKPQYFAYTSDIRHWFHQISIGSKLARFMGLHDSDDNYYRYNVLPMGWSYSPRICQCLAWCLILTPPRSKRFAADEKIKHEGNDNFDGLLLARKSLQQVEHPPKYVPLHTDAGVYVGHITLTYDNISIWTTDAAIFEALTTKVERAMHWCSVVEKEHDKVYPHQLMVEDPLPEEFKGSTHLGIQYGVRRTTKGDVPTWRLDPKRVTRYEAVLDSLATGRALSRREIARAVGTIIWHLSVIQRPLCYATTLIAILRGLTTDQPVLKKRDWNALVPLSEAHRNYLSTMLAETLRNSWHDGVGMGPPPDTGSLSTSHIIFTDASNKCMGAVLMTPDGTSHPESIPFPEAISNVHIFLKELTAVIWFGIKYVRMLGLRNTHIILVTDNSAAYFAMTNLYSSNEYANRWIRFFHQQMTKANVTFSIYQVISEDNPADCPSRFESRVCPRRLKNGLKSVRASVDGLMRSSAAGNPFIPSTDITSDNANPLRHRESTPAHKSATDRLCSLALADDVEEDEFELVVEEATIPLVWDAPSNRAMKHWFGVSQPAVVGPSHKKRARLA